MFPDLISLGPLHLKTYGFCMAVGFLVAWRVFSHLCRLSNRNPDVYNGLLTGLLIAGVLGSRIAYVILNWKTQFSANPIDILKIWEGGLVFYGGLVLALVVFFGWCLKKGVSITRMADALAVVLPLGHAFGRIGCFFYGCCWGRRTTGLLGVSFPPGSPASYDQFHAGLLPSPHLASLSVMPVQLFEAAAVAVLFGLLYMAWRRFSFSRPGLTAGLYLCGYAVVRSALECLRDDPRGTVGFLSLSQAISVGVFALGAVFAVLAFSRGKS